MFDRLHQIANACRMVCQTVRQTAYFYCAILLMAGCSSVKSVVNGDMQAPDPFVWTPEFRSDEQKNSYRIVMKTTKNSITGLVFLKKNGDKWQGTLMNEMMAKVFDFIVTDEKCELLNVISMMDKWYIKKTVAADLFFFIHIDNPDVSFYKNLKRFKQDGKRAVSYKKKQVIAGQDGVIRFINSRRGLQYEWRKMVELDPDKMLL